MLRIAANLFLFFVGSYVFLATPNIPLKALCLTSMLVIADNYLYSNKK